MAVQAKEQKLMVQMLGSFNVSYGNAHIVTEQTRNNKAIQLLKYFLCEQEHMISQEKLISELRMGDEGDDCVNILKNVVYRLRKLLDAAHLPKSSIRNGQGAYGFFCPVVCEIDTDLFERAVMHAQQKNTLEAMLAALALYHGDFLHTMAAEPWVVERALHYQTMHMDCVMSAYALAEKKARLEEIVEPLCKAAALYPYEEALQLKYILLLHTLNRPKEALHEYDRFVMRLYNDLGINPTAEMDELYVMLTTYVKNPTDNIAAVRKTIAEDGYERGAFYCNLGVFENLYQVMVRHMERSGKSISLLLCSLTEADGNPPAAGERLDLISSHFGVTLLDACRRADVYTRYSPSQFLVLLVGADYEGCEVIMKRLHSAFYKRSKMSSVVLECKSISALDLHQIMEQYDEQEA